jgi:hypothetical protein
VVTPRPTAAPATRGSYHLAPPLSRAEQRTKRSAGRR